MRKFLADIPLFVEIAKRKSFTRAADALEIPLPTVSRRIAELERGLGVKLFNRSSRKVEVTEVGGEFYTRCANILAEALDAKEQVAQSQETVAGRIRLSLTPTFYFIYMRGALCAFTAKYPGIAMYVNFSFQTTDFEDCDLQIRSGRLPDSTLKARKILDSQMGLYAAPSFFGQRLPPQKPQDLHGQDIIQIKGFFEHNLELRKGNQKARITIKPRHIVNNMGLSLEFLMAGQGIAVLNKQLANRLNQDAALIHLLPEWTCMGFETYLIHTAGPTPRRIKIFIDHLVGYFQNVKRSSQTPAQHSGAMMPVFP